MKIIIIYYYCLASVFVTNTNITYTVKSTIIKVIKDERAEDILIMLFLFVIISETPEIL